MLSNCRATFSLELPETVIEIENYALQDTYCLRNVAFPPNAVFGDNIFIGKDYNIFIEEEGEDDDDMNIFMDLQLLFGNSNGRIISALMHRFDGLHIHKLVYYQSYNQGVLQNLIVRSKLDPTGNQQDCLGMTPLHILTCSSVHDIEVYRLIVENYPANLIIEDRWGALPLLYAFWGAAPDEIIEFLLESYQSLYPGHVFNWTMMVETMGRCDTPKECIMNLLCVKQIHFPEQPIDWEYLLEMFAQPSRVSFDSTFKERLQFLFMCGMTLRVEALPFKVWRDHITSMIRTAAFVYGGDNTVILLEIQDKLAHFDGELPRLKEATSILEIALWKMKINDNSLEENTIWSQKTIKTDESEIRQQCRVSCGADVVVGHVLPFLITAY
jgi:hypothetical protein